MCISAADNRGGRLLSHSPIRGKVVGLWQPAKGERKISSYANVTPKMGNYKFYMLAPFRQKIN